MGARGTREARARARDSERDREQRAENKKTGDRGMPHRGCVATTHEDFQSARTRRLRYPELKGEGPGDREFNPIQVHDQCFRPESPQESTSVLYVHVMRHMSCAAGINKKPHPRGTFFKKKYLDFSHHFQKLQL